MRDGETLLVPGAPQVVTFLENLDKTDRIGINAECRESIMSIFVAVWPLLTDGERIE